jgi:hypothetical protein
MKEAHGSYHGLLSFLQTGIFYALAAVFSFALA